MLSPKDILQAILENPTDLAHVSKYAAPDVTYVSLNYEHADLKRIMPWCGTSKGPQAIVQTFVDVGRYWENVAFEVEALFGDDQHAAMFGKFVYKSTVMGKLVTSPFAVFCKASGGRCTYLQFMEDTLATSASFKSGGAWTFKSNPNGEAVSF
jgi:uncharacterized protein